MATKTPSKGKSNDWLHADAWLEWDDRVEVTLTSPANVMLLDDLNYASYTRGDEFTYRGGWATKSPVVISPPWQGHWNVVIDLGGDEGSVSASVQVVRKGGTETREAVMRRASGVRHTRPR